MLNRKRVGMKVVQAALVAALASVGVASQAEVGITDTEILWGNSAALSGPNAGYGAIGRAQKACFEYINAELGGVNEELPGGVFHERPPDISILLYLKCLL